MFGYRSTANASRDVLLLLVLCALSPVVYANGESMFCLHGEDAGDAATPGPEDPNTYSAHATGGCNTVLLPEVLMGAQVAANSNSANRNAELADVKKARGFLESHIFAFQEYAMEDLKKTFDSHTVAPSDSEWTRTQDKQDLFDSHSEKLPPYTILVPPKKDVNIIRRLMLGGPPAGISESILPLHVLRGRWTIEDLMNLARVNSTVETLNGNELQLVPATGFTGPRQPARDQNDRSYTGLNFTHSLSSASLYNTQFESCKDGSIILEIGAALTDGLSMESLREVHTALDASPESNSRDSNCNRAMDGRFDCSMALGSWIVCVELQDPTQIDHNSSKSTGDPIDGSEEDSESSVEWLWPIAVALTCLCLVLIFMAAYCHRQVTLVRSQIPLESRPAYPGANVWSQIRSMMAAIPFSGILGGGAGGTRANNRDRGGLGGGTRTHAVPGVNLVNPGDANPLYDGSRDYRLQMIQAGGERFLMQPHAPHALAPQPITIVVQMSDKDLLELVPGKKLMRSGATQWKTTPVDTATPENSDTPVDTDAPVDTPSSVPATHSNPDVNNTTSQDQNITEVTCLICMEAQGDHVLLPCGHGGYCHACAHQLLARQSLARMCPMCRATLTAAVQVRMHTAVGEEGQVLRGMCVKIINPGDALDKQDYM